MFGIGATKAGTSWLYSYLEGHPECIMPPIKELQYFNLNSARNYDKRIIQIRELVQQLNVKLERAPSEKQQALKLRINKLRRWQKVLRLRGDGASAYAEYMLQEAKGAKLTADITPAYALLPVERVKQMASLVAQTRFVYILRDPLDRLWSNVRMNAGRKSDVPEDVQRHALQEVDDILAGRNSPSYDRSDYAAGLDVLEAAVPKSKRKVVFFEQLFSDEAIRELCAFLGLSNHKAPLEKRIHAGVSFALDNTRRAGLQKLLAPQYHAVQKRFQTLPAAWQENMAGV